MILSVKLKWGCRSQGWLRARNGDVDGLRVRCARVLVCGNICGSMQFPTGATESRRPSERKESVKETKSKGFNRKLWAQKAWGLIRAKSSCTGREEQGIGARFGSLPIVRDRSDVSPPKDPLQLSLKVSPCVGCVECAERRVKQRSACVDPNRQIRTSKESPIITNGSGDSNVLTPFFYAYGVWGPFPLTSSSDGLVHARTF